MLSLGDSRCVCVPRKPASRGHGKWARRISCAAPCSADEGESVSFKGSFPTMCSQQTDPQTQSRRSFLQMISALGGAAVLETCSRSAKGQESVVGPTSRGCAARRLPGRAWPHQTVGVRLVLSNRCPRNS